MHFCIKNISEKDKAATNPCYKEQHFRRVPYFAHFADVTLLSQASVNANGCLCSKHSKLTEIVKEGMAT